MRLARASNVLRDSSHSSTGMDVCPRRASAKRAAARGVETDVIMSNEVFVALARSQPRTVEEIAQVSGLGAWKLQEYGGEMLAVLNGKEK